MTSHAKGNEKLLSKRLSIRVEVVSHAKGNENSLAKG